LLLSPPSLTCVRRSKSAIPDKPDDLVHDVGSLACFDYHPLDAAQLSRDQAGTLLAVARDNTQLLFNRIFSQPAVRSQDGVFAELPARATVVPREKPLPKEKPKTKWDEFARIKGIEKRKRSSKEWNEEREEFVPRFGRKSAKNDSMADWLVELPDSAPDSHDAFGEQRKVKKQAVAKQAKQELANRARARAKGSRAVAGSASVAMLSGGKKLDRAALKSTIARQLQHTTEATASAGVFVDRKEKKKNKVVVKQARPKADPIRDERAAQKQVLDRVLAKAAAPELVIEKAVERHRRQDKQQQQQQQQMNPTKKFGKGKKKK
jgi:regulator of ribosome biosynthesis